MPGQLSPQLEVALWLVELYYLIRATLLSNVQLSIGAVVARAVVAWAVVPPIGGSYVAS